MLRLIDGAVLQNDELVLPWRATAYVKSREGPRDGAIRATFTYIAGHAFHLKARTTPYVGSYNLYIYRPDPVKLALRNSETSRNDPIGSFKLETPLQPGEKYDLELRVTGSTLQAVFNGRILGSATDSRLTEGRFGVTIPNVESEVPQIVHSLSFQKIDAVDAASNGSAGPR